MEKSSRQMHVDINSCFASIEQLANPLLQGKPVAVAAYKNDNAVILAASREAKILGIKTGTKVGMAKKIYPKIIVLPPDTKKYRAINIKLKKVLDCFCPKVVAKSIDEFTLNFNESIENNLEKTAQNIKNKIANEIGEWLTVSIGIGPNRFLAKTMSGLKKPDGLVIINNENFENIYKGLDLMKLNGVNWRTKLRLQINGIEDVWDFYQANINKLKSIFHSVLAYYWYSRLRGIEIDGKDRLIEKTYSGIFSLKIKAKNKADLMPIIYQIAVKISKKLLKRKQKIGKLILILKCKNGWWQKIIKLPQTLDGSFEIYKSVILKINNNFTDEVSKVILIACEPTIKNGTQIDIFGIVEKIKNIDKGLKLVNDKYGEGTIMPGSCLGQQTVGDFISFGN
jgi:DNA polymerase-4